MAKAQCQTRSRDRQELGNSYHHHHLRLRLRWEKTFHTSGLGPATKGSQMVRPTLFVHHCFLHCITCEVCEPLLTFGQSTQDDEQLLTS